MALLLRLHVDAPEGATADAGDDRRFLLTGRGVPGQALGIEIFVQLADGLV